MRGVIADYDPAAGNRMTCYCDDCQAFARWLGREDVLDPHGGSDVVQVAPAWLRYTQGAEQLRCVRLSGKGIHRWYTACCRQPAGNTLPSARSPFVGVVTGMVDAGAEPLEALCGRTEGAVHGRYAIGGCPPGADAKASLGVVWRALRPLVRNFVAGRHRPSPFVDAATGAFVSAPQVLSAAEREALRPR